MVQFDWSLFDGATRLVAVLVRTAYFYKTKRCEIPMGSIWVSGGRQTYPRYAPKYGRGFGNVAQDLRSIAQGAQSVVGGAFDPWGRLGDVGKNQRAPGDVIAPPPAFSVAFLLV